jgi:DNA-binding MarR family transcriptional regulator
MQTKRPPSADGAADREDDVLRSLRRIIRAVDLYSRKLLAQHGLSGPQLLCLRQLDVQPLATGQLARAMNLSPATVCGILDRLEARGLVVRERQTEDKRRVVVRLSAAGRRAVRQAPPSLQESFLIKFRALPVREQTELGDTLRALVTMLAAEEIDAAPILTSGESLAGSRSRAPGTKTEG